MNYNEIGTTIKSPAWSDGRERLGGTDSRYAKTSGGVGAGSVIDTRFSGSGVISTSTYPIFIPQFQRYLVYQKARHGSSGYFTLSVYRIPVFGYDILIVFLENMKVYPSEATGMDKGKWV